MTEISGQFRRFVIVGAVGFCIDGGVLYALIRCGVGPYAARLVSFPLAVSATWYFNRSFTFASTNGGLTKSQQYARYFSIQIAGALTNYVCYVAVLRIIGVTAKTAIVGLALGRHWV
jgi:putative flippase GtrA